MISNKEWGDFQTPQILADEVCRLLKRKNIHPDYIVEPTCGVGNFICSVKRHFPSANIIGIEINNSYSQISSGRFKEENVKIINSDFFQYDWEEATKRWGNNVLIIGNPPWVTNADIALRNGTNVPIKTNLKKQRGIDALTGASNFDICEAILIHLIHSIPHLRWMAVLCKTSVARNFYEYLSYKGKVFGEFEVYQIDAKRFFGASVGACLMYVDFTASRDNRNCQVFHLTQPSIEIDRWYIRAGKICSIKSDMNIDGNSIFTWRQGIKHDCSRIMELKKLGSGYVNKSNKRVDIEEDLVFPLVKSSDIKNYIISHYERYVLVTQKYIGQPTLYIKDNFPKTWKYLQDNEELFRARKSLIYNNSPNFSIFGVGEYSFSKYKVALSGFYKKPTFALLQSKKSVMLDDTCYFISFNSYDLAYMATLILNSPLVQNFLISNSLQDAKRPYTKKLLQRLDFCKIFDTLSYGKLKHIETSLKLGDYLTQDMYNDFLILVNDAMSQKEFSFI